ncbi:indolepyruvate oxidoreductase subunit beta [candidate division WOR-3 bacterium]|nr:indolepyruvate oxidoreductase subunit beta [candidate division WOR-3 bacterium]
MNLLVCGVGGQGVILFSNIISDLAMTAGLDVKKSEVHGMAQRGGSVTTHIRYAPKVCSPLIEEGTADVIVAFEMMEALRYIHFLSPRGRLVYDPHRIDPLPVTTGAVERPTDEWLQERLAERVRHEASGVKRIAMSVPAFDAALKLGNAKAQNTVMLGAISCLLEFPEDAYHQAISRLVKPKFVELNLKAFASGRALCGKA